MTKDTNECINWPGARDKKGYGYVSIGGKMKRAHRVALAKKLGRELTRDEQTLHSCHNPSCVNPTHLRVGTVAENNREARARRSTLAKTILGIDGDA